MESFFSLKEKTSSGLHIELNDRNNNVASTRETVVSNLFVLFILGILLNTKASVYK
jgi:cation transporter-like permease